jgi:ABC-2 type transport system ATP-binding protein
VISYFLGEPWLPGGEVMAIIDVERLHKAYGGTVAVEDVSFSVAEGEIFGLLGPNGAGKTTTVETMVGLRVPDAGTIRVLGLDPVLDHAELAEQVGVQLQESALPAKLRVGEALALYRSFYTHPDDPERLLEALGLAGKRGDYFKSLSGGQKQRLSIALALIGRPRIAVLDELTTGLDPQARRNTWRLVQGVREQGVTIVLVTHSMEEAEFLCDRVALIDGGRVVALDTPQRVTEQGGGGKRVVFHPSAAFDDALLTQLPEVSELEHRGGRVMVSGSGELVNAAILTLAKVGVAAEDVRLESRTLEDAFLALTGRGIHESADAEPPRASAGRVRPGLHAAIRVASWHRSRGHTAPRPAFGALVASEWRLTRRTPIGLVWGLGLPVLLLAVFGNMPTFNQPLARFGGLTLFELYQPTLAAMALALLALVALPTALASYRENQTLKRMETTPVPPSWVLGAQVVVNLGIMLVGLLVIVVGGAVVFGSHLPRQVPGFLGSVVLAVAAMFAVGLWIAAIARSARAASAIGALLFYPSAFLAGLWVPVQSMAPVLRTISHLTPLGAAVQAMQRSMLLGQVPSVEPLLVMAAWAVVFGAISVRQFRWE